MLHVSFPRYVNFPAFAGMERENPRASKMILLLWTKIRGIYNDVEFLFNAPCSRAGSSVQLWAVEIPFGKVRATTLVFSPGISELVFFFIGVILHIFRLVRHEATPHLSRIPPDRRFLL